MFRCSGASIYDEGDHISPVSNLFEKRVACARIGRTAHVGNNEIEMLLRKKGQRFISIQSYFKSYTYGFECLALAPVITRPIIYPKNAFSDELLYGV